MSEVVGSTFFDSSWNIKKVVCSIACVAIVTTIATLFFTQVIPLNSSIASIGAGSAFASLNLVPIVYWIYAICKKQQRAPPSIAVTTPIAEKEVKEIDFNWDGIYFSAGSNKSVRNNATGEDTIVANCRLHVDLSHYQKQNVSLDSLVEGVKTVIATIHDHYGKRCIFSITLDNCNGYLDAEPPHGKYIDVFYSFWKELGALEPIVQIGGPEESYWKGLHYDTIETWFDDRIELRITAAVENDDSKDVAQLLWRTYVNNQDKHAPIEGTHSKKCPVKCLFSATKVTTLR